MCCALGIRSKRSGKLCDDDRHGIKCDKPDPDLIKHPLQSIGCTSWLAQPYDNSRGDRTTPNYDMPCDEESLLGESQDAKFFLDTIKSAA